jgi:hypothetical protein
MLTIFIFQLTLIILLPRSFYLYIVVNDLYYRTYYQHVLLIIYTEVALLLIISNITVSNKFLICTICHQNFTNKRSDYNAQMHKLNYIIKHTIPKYYFFFYATVHYKNVH